MIRKERLSLSLAQPQFFQHSIAMEQQSVRITQQVSRLHDLIKLMKLLDHTTGTDQQCFVICSIHYPVCLTVQFCMLEKGWII